MRNVVSTVAAVLLATSLAAPARATGDDDVRGIVHLTVPYDIAGLPPSTTSVDVECRLWAEHDLRPSTWQFKRLANRAMTRRGVVTLVLHLRPYSLVPRPTQFRCELKVTALDEGEARTFYPYLTEHLIAGNLTTGRKIVPAVKRFKANTVRVEGALTDAAFIADEARPSTETSCPCGCDGNPSQGTSACTGGTPARTPAGPKIIAPIVGRNPDGTPTAPAPPRYALAYVAPGQTVPGIHFRGAATIAPAP